FRAESEATSASAKKPRAPLSTLPPRKAAPDHAGTPAQAGVRAGRRSFDGAALEGPAPAADPAGGPASVPAPAERGDVVKFNGQTLPSRMFSDKTKISGHLISAIDATRKTLDIAIYELAIREVRDALLRAKSRGVRVRLVMDQSHLYPEKSTSHRTPEVQSLIDAGFELKTLRGGDAHGIMHNKFAVFDGALLETGSYNWSRAADVQHYENALFDDSAARIASYQRYWDWLWTNARAVDDRRPPARIVLDEDGHSAPLPHAPQDSARVVRFNGAALPRESFTPHGTVANVVAAIDAARKTLVIANFSFSHADLLEALKRAKARRVSIRIVFDRAQYGLLPEMAALADLGFDVRLSNGRDGQTGVMHSKFVVFDGELVETGSFNWTFNGELNNYENAVFLDAPDDAYAWSAFFERIWAKGRAPTDADRRQERDPRDAVPRPSARPAPRSFPAARSAPPPRTVGPVAHVRMDSRPARTLSRKEAKKLKKQKRQLKKQNRRRNRFGR
ncbi:MAG: phospholipase D-like domain-containing protein, partial [Elusimicrobiota bacterium]